MTKIVDAVDGIFAAADADDREAAKMHGKTLAANYLLNHQAQTVALQRIATALEALVQAQANG